jgi:hypothetical protein
MNLSEEFQQYVRFLDAMNITNKATGCLGDFSDDEQTTLSIFAVRGEQSYITQESYFFMKPEYFLPLVQRMRSKGILKEDRRGWFGLTDFGKSKLISLQERVRN